MLFFVQFGYQGKDWLLYQDGSFVGSASESEIHLACQQRTAVAIAVGGFQVISMTLEDLRRRVGIPYKIIDFFAGVHWEAVQLINE